MPPRPSTPFTILAGGFLILLVTCLASAQTPDDRLGPWRATLETPGGDLRLQVTVSLNENGEQTAVLESLDQAPGQDIPVSTVTLDADRFSFSIQQIGARFDGEWNAQTQSYDGVFSQGMQIPTRFARPAQSQAVFMPELDGMWEGHLDRDDTRLEFTLEVQTGEAGTQLALNSITQGVYGIPVTGLARTGSFIEFTIPAANVTYTFERDADTLNGQWRRPGFEDVDVSFVRIASEITGPNRPQTPLPPFPYTELDVRIDNPDAEGVTLAGTLTVPQGEGPFPGVVLISGSGPQDRNETVWTHQPFAVLADYLTREGIAVLRYDDRGFEQSSGDFASATSYDFASDAEAVAAFMREQADIRSVGLIGHSEGGLIAPVVAVEDPATAFIVLLAGPGTPGHQFVVDQMVANNVAMDVDPSVIAARTQVLQSVTDAVGNAASAEQARTALEGLLTDDRLATLEITADQKAMFIQQQTRDWYRALLEHDPAHWLSQMDQPVLALQGTLDLQIVAEPNVSGLEAALGDHDDARIVVLEGRNHLFQKAGTGLIAEYAQIEETMDPEAMAIIADWINARFGAER